MPIAQRFFQSSPARLIRPSDIPESRRAVHSHRAIHRLVRIAERRMAPNPRARKPRLPHPTIREARLCCPHGQSRANSLPPSEWLRRSLSGTKLCYQKNPRFFSLFRIVRPLKQRAHARFHALAWPFLHQSPKSVESAVSKNIAAVYLLFCVPLRHCRGAIFPERDSRAGRLRKLMLQK
jgi:hypothetical protein